MKINIITSGRFHVCDLARELSRQGYDVRFYSYVPTKRLLKFGLSSNICYSFFYVISPFILLERIIKCQLSKELRIKALDLMTGLLMRDCDVCIAMSGSFVYAIKKAKRNGAIVILERGSKHVLAQKIILDQFPKSRKISDFTVKREQEGYKIADYISIASQHVKRSFEEYGVPSSKLFVNAYGVDLDQFYIIPGTKKEYDLIMVGNWSVQKGCDLIVEVVREMGLRFLHVGAIYDLEFPDGDMFTHIDPVDQKDLVYFYNKAKIFILPSRQEGLALVQSQAIACNLPVVGSPDSGAQDLKSLVNDPEKIIIIKDYSVSSIIEAVKEAISQFNKMNDSLYAGDSVQKLTWEAYGLRYSDFLKRISKK